MCGLIKIEGFDKYYFCPRKIKVFSTKRSGIAELKQQKTKAGEIHYFLFKNGERIEVSLYAILRRVVRYWDKNPSIKI